MGAFHDSLNCKNGTKSRKSIKKETKRIARVAPVPLTVAGSFQLSFGEKDTMDRRLDLIMVT